MVFGCREEEATEIHGHITSLAVARTHRKLGLATKLMQAAREHRPCPIPACLGCMKACSPRPTFSAFMRWQACCSDLLSALRSVTGRQHEGNIYMHTFGWSRILKPLPAHMMTPVKAEWGQGGS